jgi:branched-chain amino acid transport system ATP-binding protein
MLLDVKGLNVSYGEAQALWDLDLTIGQGEIVSIVGVNGAGKSTLVNTISGLLRPKSGSILMDGVDLSRTPSHRICEYGIAIVPEGRRILPQMSVADNLDLGAYRPGARAQRIERLEWIHSLFPILATRANQAAGTLSGGEQQMLAIGRALMSVPKLLLLDEPSLGLAPVVVDTIFDVVVQIKESVSVCLVEQNIVRALRISDRGYVIQEGRIVLGDSADRLLDNEDVRRACLGM